MINKIRCLFGHDWEDSPVNITYTKDIIEQTVELFTKNFKMIQSDEIKEYIDLDSILHLITNFYNDTIHRCYPRGNYGIEESVCLRCGKISNHKVQNYINRITEDADRKFDRQMRAAKRKLEAKRIVNANKTV